MSDGYLGKDTEHVFEAQEQGSTGLVTVWLPALWVRIDGKKHLTHMEQTVMGAAWASEPKLVRIADIAHLLTAKQLAEMRRPGGPPVDDPAEPEPPSRWKVLMQ